MADQVITITIPEAKVATALEGFLKIYPNNETISDPEWVDPDPNSDNELAPQIAKYTNKQWIKEKFRRILISHIRRGLQITANESAQVASDDTILT